MRWARASMVVCLVIGIRPEQGLAQEEVVVTTPAGTQHTMMPVPAGPFTMGTSEEQFRQLQEMGGPIYHNDDAEETVHTVFLGSSYFLDKYEVTTAQWNAFASVTDRPLRTGPDDHPVITINPQGAHDYCGWAGLRLGGTAAANRGGVGEGSARNRRPLVPMGQRVYSGSRKFRWRWWTC